jgi:hypothetical protein
MTTPVVVTEVATAASNNKAMMREEENGGVNILFIPVSSALKQKMRQCP